MKQYEHPLPSFFHQTAAQSAVGDGFYAALDKSARLLEAERENDL